MTTSTPITTTKRITGYDAIEAHGEHGGILCSYADPTSDARNGITTEEAEEIAAVDHSLVYWVPDLERFEKLYPGPYWFVETYDGGWLLVCDGSDILSWVRTCDVTTAALDAHDRALAAADAGDGDGFVSAYAVLCGDIPSYGDKCVPVSIVEQARRNMGLKEDRIVADILCSHSECCPR